MSSSSLRIGSLIGRGVSLTIKYGIQKQNQIFPGSSESTSLGAAIAGN